MSPSPSPFPAPDDDGRDLHLYLVQQLVWMRIRRLFPAQATVTRHSLDAIAITWPLPGDGAAVQAFLPLVTVPLEHPEAQAGQADGSGVLRQHERQDRRRTRLTQRLRGHGQRPARAGHVIDEQHGAVQTADC